MRISMKATVFTIGLVAVTAFAAYGAIELSNQLSSVSMDSHACSQKGAEHIVAIQNSSVMPSHTDGRLCDRLTIKNEDDVTRFLAFGPHDSHQAYDGVSERTLIKGQGFTVTMDKTGSYIFHDHLHDEVRGTFTVR